MSDHIGVPLYRKSANDPENDFHGRLAKEIDRLRRIPPQPMFSDLHRSVLKSRPFTKSVTDKHTDSLTGNNLNRYLKRAVDDPEWAGNIYDDPFFAALRPKPILPEPYCSLVALQSSSGLWADLIGVLKCLSMPTAYRMKDRYQHILSIMHLSSTPYDTAAPTLSSPSLTTPRLLLPYHSKTGLPGRLRQR